MARERRFVEAQALDIIKQAIKPGVAF